MLSLFLQNIPLGLLAVLLLLMLRNRAYRAWPWFFGYVTFGVSVDVARFAIQSHPRLFYFAYWLTDAGFALLGLLAMYEILRRILRVWADIWWTYLIFPSVVAIGAGFSLWRMHAVPPQVHGRLLLCIVVGEIAVRFVQVFIVPLTLLPLLGRLGHRYPLGISVGFGFYSTVALLITTKLSDLGTRFIFSREVISHVAYAVTVLIWIWCFRKPEEDEPSPTLEQVATAADTTRYGPSQVRRMRWPLFRIRSPL
jgi:hypothetical protein